MKTQKQITTLSDLTAVAKNFADSLVDQDVVSLVGPLGAGKSTFLFHVLQQLKMPKDQLFSSPTFAILNQYELPKFVINHIDLYRLQNFTELESLDILPYFSLPHHITFVEWGDRFAELQDLYTKKIKIAYVDGHAEQREFSFQNLKIT